MIAETAESLAKSPPQPRKRRISKQDIEAICSMVAKRMTESEACRTLDIEPKVYFRYKEHARHKREIDAILERTRGAMIKAHLENIEDAEHGRNGHRPDWRASHALLAIKSPERFAQGQQQGNVTNNTAVVMLAGGEDGLRKLIASVTGQARLANVTTSPALPAPADKPENAQSSNE